MPNRISLFCFSTWRDLAQNTKYTSDGYLLVWRYSDSRLNFKKLGLGSDECYCKVLKSSCLPVPSLRVEGSGCDDDISLFQFSNSKASLENWDPQTCLLLPARSSQDVKDTGLKQNRLGQRMHDSCCTDGELISLCLKGWKLQKSLVPCGVS